MTSLHCKLGTKILFLILYTVSLCLWGCSTSWKELEQNIPLINDKIDQVDMLPDIQKRLPLRVAILPFENISDAPQAAELVRRSFFNQFSSKKFKDVELYQVNERLRQKGWRDDFAFLSKSPELLGDLLQADGLIYGKITEFNRFYAGTYSRVSVALEAKLVSAETGNVLWQATHCASSHEGALP